MEFLSEPNMALFGLLVGAVGILVTVAIWMVSRHRKRISWLPKAYTPLTNKFEGTEGRIAVLLDGKPIQDPEVSLARIRNSGNQPVLPGDYLAPMELGALGSGSDKQGYSGGEIFSAEIAERQPPNLDLTIRVHEKKAQVVPILLNPGDTFTLRVIGNGLQNLSLEGRIVGVSNFLAENLEKHQRRIDLLALPALLSVMVLAAMLTELPGAWSLLSLGSLLLFWPLGVVIEKAKKSV